MQLHSMKNAPGAVRKKKRVGCGESSGHGKTSGRGTKGQMSRSGHKRKATFEGGQMRLIRKIPKRGFNNPVKVFYAPVNLADLEAFEAGTEITPAVLEQAGLVHDLVRPVKVLGDGELTKKFTVKAHAFSAAAREKITAAGGECITLD
ncbi:MAG TPA: 50S ribosomal protein L15 [Kiritimatiellia bacterium]|nr:50S ribosomal protein L15 [Kiritimatiellia bacterium]HMO98840.1 50S ribosomal protein L15 [Kiritimatiellia bacterium]HMP96212.1 50S ribosomal protein L15 [Kiritimatiellia bacterium]